MLAHHCETGKKGSHCLSSVEDMTYAKIFIIYKKRQWFANIESEDERLLQTLQETDQTTSVHE